MDPARMFKESLTSRPELENLTPGIREQPGSKGAIKGVGRSSPVYPS